MKLTLIFPLAICVFACTQTRTSETEESAHLGTLAHSFDISEAAKPHFDEGLLLLHSFEYDDANEAFRKAQEVDKQEQMAYWGLAMTHYKALWGLQDVDAGRSVIDEWNENKGDADSNSELEGEFWKGVEILYGEGELKDRNQAYLAHMKSMYEANPGNLEVAAFYSLALMWADYDNESNLKLSSKVAAGIIEESPTHPGALHYMIHANDNPEFAQVAINAADAYAEVAPDAAHALHMPSHIYVALGMWNEVVTSNQDSYAASLKRVANKNLDGSKRGYHSMAWLHYGYLQQGRYDEATELLKEMIGYHRLGEGSDSYLINMQNQQRIESGTWPEGVELQYVDDKTLGLESKSAQHFVRSLLAFDGDDASSIQREIDTLSQKLESAKLLVGESGVALCSAGPTRYAPTQTGLEKTQVIIHQMKALIAMLDREAEMVESELRMATALEKDAGYDPGPPFIAYPSFEMYGDWLLEQGRYEDALEQFRISSERRTNRTKALRGQLEALKQLERLQEAEEVKSLLDKAIGAKQTSVS